MRKPKKAESYLELLRDPRWQKARLDTMQRAGFACEGCGDKETTLNVHHKNYKRNHAPWEYDSNNFVCLCRDCHEFVHEQKEMINNLLPYVAIDLAEFLSAFVLKQWNAKSVGMLHRREFAYNKDFYLGLVASVMLQIATVGFLKDMSELLDRKEFCEDLSRLVTTYKEAKDEH